MLKYKHKTLGPTWMYRGFGNSLSQLGLPDGRCWHLKRRKDPWYNNGRNLARCLLQHHQESTHSGCLFQKRTQGISVKIEGRTVLHVTIYIHIYIYICMYVGKRAKFSVESMNSDWLECAYRHTPEYGTKRLCMNQRGQPPLVWQGATSILLVIYWVTGLHVKSTSTNLKNIR